MALKYDFEMFTVIPEDQQIRVEAEGLPRELAGARRGTESPLAARFHFRRHVCSHTSPQWDT